MNEDSSKSSIKSKKSNFSKLSDKQRAQNLVQAADFHSLEFDQSQRDQMLRTNSVRNKKEQKQIQRGDVSPQKDTQFVDSKKNSNKFLSSFPKSNSSSKKEEHMNRTEQSHDRVVPHNFIREGSNDNNRENYSQQPSAQSNLDSKRNEKEAVQGDSDSVINEWCEKNLNYGFKSHSVFLRSIELKYQIKLQRLFFVVMLAIVCTEAFIRAIATQLTTNKTGCIVILVQQIIVLVSFCTLHRYAPKRSYNRYLVHYTIKIVILILQLPLFSSDSITMSTMLSNQTLMLISFVLIYSPIAECSLISCILIVLNSIIRSFLFKPVTPNVLCIQGPEWEQLFSDGVVLDSAKEIREECQLEITKIFQEHTKVPWHDTLIFGFIQAIILCVIVFFSLRQNILEYKLRGKLQNDNEDIQFDDPTIGVYDCQSILQLSQLQKVLNAVEVGYAIAEYMTEDQFASTNSNPYQAKSHSQINTGKKPSESRNPSRFSQPDFPFKVTNQSMRSFLCGIDQEMSISANFPMFQKCNLKTLQLDLNLLDNQDESRSASSHFSKQTDKGYHEQVDAKDGVRNFSLMELILFIQQHGKYNGGDLLIKTDAYPAKQSDAKYKLSQSSGDQVCKAPTNQDESQVKSDQAQIHSASFAKQEADAALTKGWIIFQLSVRPVIYMGKRQSLVSLTRVNSFIRKVVGGVKEKLTSTLPAFFEQSESMQPFYSIIKTSKFLEKQMSKLVGADTRTGLVQHKVRNSQKSQKQSGDVFTMYQILLANMWAFGKQQTMRIKGHLAITRLKQGRLSLNFQRVSKTSQTVENHVKKFMLQFGQQTAAKDIQIKIQQGSMPDHQLYTDWNLYDQILFQIVQNAVQNSVQGGALSIQIYFRKEISQTRKTENSNDLLFEVGRIVTVVKDNGFGIEEATQQKLNQHLGTSNGFFPIFKPYFNQASSLAFGLKIAQQLVECLGGHLIFKSIVGHGTAITFDVQVTTYPLRHHQPIYNVVNGDLQLQIPLFRRASLQMAESNSSESHIKKRGDNSPSSIYHSDRDSIPDSEISGASKDKLLEKHLTLFDSAFMTKRQQDANKNQFPHLNFSKSQELTANFKFGRNFMRRDQQRLPEMEEESKESLNKDSQNNIQSRSENISLREVDTGEQGQVIQDYATESKKVYMNIAEVLRQTISKHNSQPRIASEEVQKQEKIFTDNSQSKSNHTEQRKSFASKRSHSDPNVNQHLNQNHSVINPQLKSLSKDSSLPYHKELDSKSEVARIIKQKISSNSGAPSEHNSSVHSVQDIRLIQVEEEHKQKIQEPPTFNQMRQDSFNRHFIEKRDSSKRQPLIGSNMPDLQQSYPQNVYEQIILEASNSVKDDDEDAELQQNKKSDHQFSDLSIGDSEHFNLGQHQKNVMVFSERPLYEFQNMFNQLLKQKGIAIFDMRQPLFNSSPSQSSRKKGKVEEKVHFAVEENQPSAQNNSSQANQHDNSVQDSQAPIGSKRSQSSAALKMNVASRQKDDRQRSQFSKIASARENIMVLQEPKISNILSQRGSKSSFSQNSQKNLAGCTSATCRNVLIIESEVAAIQTIQDFIEQIDDRGCDVAMNPSQGLRLLAKKLKANCNCGKDNYELIFISMDYQFEGIETVKKVEETFRKWNLRLAQKGHSPVSEPQIIGLQTFANEMEIDNSKIIVLQKPVDLDMLTKVVEDTFFV